MIFTVKEQTRLTDTVYRLTLTGDTSAITRPGQFVQIQLPGFYLRRPISVCDWDADTLTLIYKVVGEGTKAMTALKPGTELDLLTGLGNGFDTSLCGDKPLLVGGGVGRSAHVRAVQGAAPRGQASQRGHGLQHRRRGLPGRGVPHAWACPLS